MFRLEWETQGRSYSLVPYPFLVFRFSFLKGENTLLTPRMSLCYPLPSGNPSARLPTNTKKMIKILYIRKRHFCQVYIQANKTMRATLKKFLIVNETRFTFKNINSINLGKWVFQEKLRTLLKWVDRVVDFYYHIRIIFLLNSLWERFRHKFVLFFTQLKNLHFNQISNANTSGQYDISRLQVYFGSSKICINRYRLRRKS